MLLHAAVMPQFCADLSLSVPLPPHLGQILWSVTSFSILFILLLFVGIGLSYMPFFRRCSLLWWIWAPCSSWKEQRAFRGLSRTWRKWPWDILNSEFCIPLMHWSSTHSYKNFHKEKADRINTLHVKYFSTAPLGCCRSSPGLRGRRQHFPMWTNRCWRVEYESHTDWTEFHWAAPDKPRHKSSAMHSFQRLTDRHPVTYFRRITLGMINSLNFINNFLFKSYPDMTVYLFW